MSGRFPESTGYPFALLCKAPRLLINKPVDAAKMPLVFPLGQTFHTQELAEVNPAHMPHAGVTRNVRLHAPCSASGRSAPCRATDEKYAHVAGAEHTTTHDVALPPLAASVIHDNDSGRLLLLLLLCSLPHATGR